MKPNFALDLGHDGITLLHRAKGGWTHVGGVALDDLEMTEHLTALRQKAETLSDGKITTKLIIPNTQILYTTLEAPGPDDIAREVQIRVALEGVTPYAVSELVFDWRAEGDVARVAVLAQETMEEAEAFAAQFGFNPVSFVARPEGSTFSGEPFFGKTRASARILSANERVVPDASPVPRNPRSAVAAPSAPPQQEHAQVPHPAPRPETPPVAPSAQPVAQPGEQPAPQPEPAPGDAPLAAPPADRRDPPPVQTRTAQAKTATPVLAPFPPTPDETVDRPKAAAPAPKKVAQPQPASPAPQPSAPVHSTKAPTPGSGVPLPDSVEARVPASARASTTQTASNGQGDAPATPAFSSRRRPAQAGQASAVSLPPGPPVAPQPNSPAPAVTAPSATPTPAAPTSPRPSQAPVAATSPTVPTADTEPVPGPEKPLHIDDLEGSAPRILSGEAEKRRQAMAKAIGSTLPDESKPSAGLLERVSSGLADLSSGAGARVAKLKRKPNAEAPSQDVPLEAPAVEAGGALPAARKRADRDKENEERSKEAEKLTVFGARASQASGSGRPGLGLILTLVLLLLMAMAALWSVLFFDDGDVSLFNPKTEEEIVAGAETETPETPPADPTSPDAATPEVLSQEEAAANYALSGVYEKAPRALGDPDTARNDDIYVASIDPTVSANDALALPATSGSAALPPSAPIPPPPPGTSFELDENGLVIATPEGAVSPSGVVVTKGRPAVVPSPRPEGLVTAPQDDAQLAPVDDAPTIPPRERPENLIELAERAQLGGQSLAELGAIRPRSRPDALDTSASATPTEQAAATPPTEARPEDVVGATELAVLTSLRPGARPNGFSAIVDRARAAGTIVDSSDGSVVNAAATITPSIPTTASVARQATMENALNLSRINLIGVYGSSASRRALVRLGSGRYVKVEVGDRLDGGRVTAISESRLSYQKGGRQVNLQVIPLG